MEKPTIKLTPLEKTVVNTPTQHDFDTLMRVYECGGWKWDGDMLPTEVTLPHVETIGVGLQTCLTTGTYNGKSEGKFAWCKFNEARQDNKRIILPEEFYEIQRVTLRQVIEVNRYFDMRK